MQDMKEEYAKVMDDIRIVMDNNVSIDMLRPLLMLHYPNMTREQATELCEAYLRDVHKRPQLLKE